MISIANEKWIADMGNMTCLNSEDKIVAAFERNGGALQ
jgi:hypothetical protein